MKRIKLGKLCKTKSDKGRRRFSLYIKALIIKFVMCFAVLWIILGGFHNVNLGHIFMMSLIITIVSFILGDLYLLPKFENWGATMADFFLALAVIWFYCTNFVDVNFSVLTAAAITSLVLAVGEWFYHQYIDKRLFTEDDKRSKKLETERLQTEFGEEMEPPNEDENRK